MAVSKQQPSLSSFSILITADFKPEQIRIVSFITMTSDRNDSVKILNFTDSFLPDISASFLKSNYAKLLAKSIFLASFIFSISEIFATHFIERKI